MFKPLHLVCLPALLLCLFASNATAQSFRVQCPKSTTLHPSEPNNPNLNPVGGRIKCQQISGGDGFATMGDGVQTYLFGFGPLSGLAAIVNGLPGTQPPSVFNVSNLDAAVIGDIAIGAPIPNSTTFNGAVGLVPDPESVPANSLTGHVDPRLIMDVGVMNASQPAPLMAIDEDDEFFLTLTNVGQIMRPDLFEQHTVHFHGYPNASAFYDGVPDASIAINIGGSFTYYYLAPDAGTYFWHCHISPPEHLQMGMVGQIYVRPRQNRVPTNASLKDALVAANLKAANNPLATGPHLPSTYDATTCSDILCTGQTPAPAVGGARAPNVRYAYNDGDGSTAYDVEYPIQMMGFDSNFHFVGMTFNPESFTDMKDKYFMLNGRSYPDTVGGYVCAPADPYPGCAGMASGTVVPGPMQTQSTDGTMHSSQPLPTVINIPAGGRALLRISDLNVTEFHTLASLGIPMKVVGVNARLLRDLAGNDMSYTTNSITLGGGESLDVILDAAGYTAGQKFYLYTPNLDHLSNGAENFGGMMTEVNICTSVNPTSKQCS
ncbi:multicopper oxidase domain-containing protein [Piscinibacter sp.]|uniref:multicopper oxidase domain-containing protein n=1 Tax=Piscinibacter sp. TaxID=1903157 RepID=UPI003559471A